MRPKHSRYVALLTAGLLLLLINIGSGLVLDRMYHTARNAADSLVQRAASVAESTINRLFLQVDGTLAGLPAVLGQVAQNGQLDGALASHALRNLSFQNLTFRDLLLVRPDGIAWATAQPASRGRPLPVDPAEFATSQSGAVTITGPVRNTTTGEWALFFVRPITLPNTGMVYAAAEVPIPLIATLLAPVADMRGLSISVERAGGQLLAGVPHDEAKIGQQLNPAIGGLPKNGSAFEMPSRFGSTATVTAVRPTLYRAIFIAVSLDTTAALADWSEDRDRLIAVTAVASLFIIAVTLALTLVLRQRQRTETERLRGRAMLESAIDSMADGFVMFNAEDRLVVCNSRFKDFYAISAPFIVPGVSFGDLVREGCKQGQYPQSDIDPDTFAKEMVEWHRGNHAPIERLLPDGRWLLITERRMPDGGTVGIRTDITALKQAMRELVVGERRYRALARAGALVTWQAAADGHILEAPGWEALTGQPEDALRDGSWISVIHPDDQTRITPTWVATCSSSGTVDAEFRVFVKGFWRWVRIRGVPVYEQAGGEPVEWVGTIHDVHDFRTAQTALAESEARFARAIRAVGIGTWDWDLTTDVLHVSPGYETLYGLPDGALPTARKAAAAVHPDDIAAFSAEIAQALTSTQTDSYDIEFRIKKPDDAVRWLRMQGRAERGAGGSATRVSGVTQDVTAKRQVELQLAHMARHDTLTDLPNRLLLREKMDEIVARAKRGDASAILCLDLDRFKQVNDTLGHPAGDTLLKAVTARLLSCVRETDLVSRTGGDEFAIVQSSVDQPRDAATLAQRIIDILSNPYNIEGHVITIGTSIGIALAPEDGTDLDQLLKNADLALYRAKLDGRGRYRLFEPEMNARMQARHALEQDLRRAVADQEFEVHYQPVVDIRTQKISGFEALLRWQHPERGLISPDAFIALSEELGLMGAIGGLVLAQACAEAMRWPSHMKVAANLSSSQFAGGRVTDMVTRALRLSGLAPERLELEITETVLLKDNQETLTTLHELQALGVTISMDDFGTGYSSLSYILKFPFKKIKIDQSFIRGLSINIGSSKIISAILNLCESLAIKTTAEGVETEFQLQWLTAAGCTEAQGFLFSSARPAAEIPHLLQLPHCRATTTGLPHILGSADR